MYAPSFALIFMIILIVTVTVTLLNAFIAFINDAFQEVLSGMDAVLKKQNASIIWDLYSVLNEDERKTNEEKNKWKTMIVPSDI